MRKRSILKRAVKVVWVLFQYFVLYKWTKHRKKSLGRRIRESCELLGSTFIKVGQLLSTRYDLLRREDCEELQKLLDSIPPFSYSLVEEIVEHDFGLPPKKLFKKFEKRPIASASVAQVHKAWLHSGECVAVKVRRPYIGKVMEKDLTLAKFCVGIVSPFSTVLRLVRAKEVLCDIEEMLLKEIDFRNEEINLKKLFPYVKRINKRMKRKYGGDLLVPKVFPKFCSYNVVTMEFMEGVQLSRYKEAEEYDPMLSFSTLMNGSLCTLLRGDEYFFHGDPHPANLLMRKNGDLVLLDYGSLGIFDKKTSIQMGNLLLRVYLSDVDKLVDAIEEFGTLSKKKRDAIRPDIELYLKNAKMGGIGSWFIGIVNILIKHRIKVPRSLAFFGRTMVLLDGIVQMVEPEKTVLDVIGDQLVSELKRRTIENVRTADVSPLIYVLSEKFNESPKKLAGVADKYLDDPIGAFEYVRERVFANG